MNRPNLIYAALSLILITGTFFLIKCSPGKQPGKEKKPTRVSPALPSRLEAWKNDKLSLFVHFGVYSKLAGTWDDKQVDGPAEEIWARAGMFIDDYEKAARDFDPGKWAPREIVSLGRDIGTRTIILTAKHHDGFCLFETETTKFNTVDFIPFNRDLVAELSEACEAGNMKFGISFSLTDWHLPASMPMSRYQANPVTDPHHQINVQQIRELLSNHGPVSEIHFHSGINTPEQSRELYQLVKELQPNCLVSNGIGNDLGDFISTSFNHYPDTPVNGPWLMPASIHPSTRGYHEGMQPGNEIETARRKVRELVEVISSGGNYAFNIGLRGDGSAANFEKEILKEVGRWIKVNRKAVFGTSKKPFRRESPYWKVTRDRNKLYLFIDSIPDNGRIELPNLENTITAARFLGSGIEPGFTRHHQSPQITWTSPAMADPMQLPVIEVELKDTVTVVSPESIAVKDTVVLSVKNAAKQTSISGTDRFGTIPSTTGMAWAIDADQTITATLKYSPGEEGRKLLVKTNNTRTNIQLESEQTELIRNAEDTIETGKIYRSAPFHGALDEVHVNTTGDNRVQVARSSWMALSSELRKTLNPLPMTAYYYYIEIESENNQQYCYSISGNDGLQVWLNKKELFLSRNTTRKQPLTRKLVFDLEKGRNILLIKNYNRLGTEDHFDLEPLPDARWFLQPLTLPGTPRTIEIKASDTLNPHEDINLPNFSLVLTPGN